MEGFRYFTQRVPQSLWNPVAMKHAFIIALVVAPLWAFLLKPLLEKYHQQSEPLHLFLWALLRGVVMQFPILTSVKLRAQAEPKPSRGRERPSGHTPELGSAKRYATGGKPITAKALDDLFRSPDFEVWYGQHRQSLLEKVRIRCSQQLWASIATLAVLVFGAFALPLFSFSNEEKTLYAVLRPFLTVPTFKVSIFTSGKDKKEIMYSVIAQLTALGHAVVVLVAAFALFTTSFMPVGLKQTAAAALVAFLALVAEATRVEQMAVGAGFVLLFAPVAWRIASVFV
ncbi:hypothetical protein, conserved [Trypanosoma brucei brucei TREU927]|uniref:Nuclear transmembrane protein n=1 Tax=Trypanosoma brucei brucei (strain 927/4 GUTat10.1) TaxID=185431 RepID=Q38BN5_TRYB2|nr:hypothetical protein, conserved [Trypanosoma brucei brucei TREU927]EAN77785.1 hypothetical protein, conserved [Trypanosoma brucei brucei TREU927]